jgi:DUF4097 and DUF4098 domain-containing protein YvlB
MADPKMLHISTRSGNVRVTATPGAALAVDGGIIEVATDGTTRVIGARGSDRIDVTCSAGTDVVIGTVSGSVELRGELGAASVATISGKINVERARRVDARTKSGRVEIAECDEECRIVTVTSRVKVGKAERAAIAGVSGRISTRDVARVEVKTVSGAVDVGTSGPPHVSVHTVSGKVDVDVPADARPSTRFRTLSGRVSCECSTGDDGEIAVATVSGAIRVSCK